MAESEENQEQVTAEHEEIAEPIADAHHEQQHEPQEAHDAPHQQMEEKIETHENERHSEEVEAHEEHKRRPSSGKRASIDERVKAVPVNQDTFVPPTMPRQSLGDGERRMSSPPDAKRPSLPLSEKTPRLSSGMTRRSKFGGLSSKARMVLGSIVDIKTTTSEYYDKKAAKYQNTYKLESDNPFNTEKVYKILKEVMQDVLENLQYDPEKCASTAKFASKEIRSKVKQLEFDRYKLVCIVSIGEKNSQDVYATCRFLWDPEKDRFSFYSLENTHVYAIAYCFGLYYE